MVATGDFTHPAWCAELKDKLVPAEPGLFRLREDREKDGGQDRDNRDHDEQLNERKTRPTTGRKGHKNLVRGEAG